jgi:hypothetical protein
LSDGRDGKTKDELLAEIAALEDELGKRGARGAEGKPERSSAPVFSAPVTRRESLVSWVAPVILSLPVLQGVGILRPGTAHASTDDSIASVPTVKPTVTKKAAPTLKTAAPTVKTAAPTAAATAAPTSAPTAAPTAVPTRAGRCIVAPTAAHPTTAPTLGMAAAPDARPSPVGFVALGGARAAARDHVGI